jgi:V/A-type H+-transporting ATPase subunit I
MVVTIQAIRLEYYEFFGKFFMGGGVAYKPIGLGEEPDLAE